MDFHVDDEFESPQPPQTTLGAERSAELAEREASLLLTLLMLGMAGPLLWAFFKLVV